MSRKSWKFWSALTSVVISAAVNIATELKYDLWAWVVVLALFLVTVWLGLIDKAEPSSVAGTPMEKTSQVVLHWEERNGDIHRTVSTTSETVATEFIKRHGR